MESAIIGKRLRKETASGDPCGAGADRNMKLRRRLLITAALIGAAAGLARGVVKTFRSIGEEAVKEKAMKTSADEAAAETESAGPEAETESAGPEAEKKSAGPEAEKDASPEFSA